jgi:hypothetical protein
MYVYRFQNVFLRCPKPRLHCFLSSNRLSFRSLKQYTGGIRSRFALSVLFIHWGSSTSNFSLIVVHLAFTTANSVHLGTNEYLLNLSDTDTVSEHLPIADIAKGESSHMWEGQLNSLIHIAWQVHVCTPASTRVHSKQTLPLSFQYTELFEVIVGVLTTCHTQYTWDYRVDVCRITKGAHIEHL